MRKLHLGISTCPNDTYLFHGLLTGKVLTPGLELTIELMDVQELNARLEHGEFDVAKASYHLALRHVDELVALPTGSALGFGNGPLLLGSKEQEGQVPGPSSRVLCPGAATTATLLYRLFYGDAAVPEQVVFSEIMPALVRGEADFGVCIHEGRFTYEESALGLVEDLGAAWESATGAPLPLGGLFARRTLPEEVLEGIQDALSRSLAYADAHAEEARETMARYAQELDDEVLDAHVALYVNGWTRRLGAEGEAAIQELGARAAQAGIKGLGQGLEVYVPRRERRLFHLIRADGEDLDTPPRTILAANGERPMSPDGFVHLSFADQLEGTLATHFQGVERVLLVELSRPEVLADLRVETSRDGDDFPHLYRPIALERDLIRDAAGPRVWELRPQGDAWHLPRDLQQA